MLVEFDSIIDRLVQTLNRVDSPAMRGLRTPLSEEEFQANLMRFAPHQKQWFDSTIRLWWSWHNGLETSSIDRRFSGAGSIAPDGLTLYSFEVMLKEFSEFDRGPGEEDWPIFPISFDESGGLLALRKRQLDDPWSLWFMGDDPEWISAGEYGTEPPTLSNYLLRLIECLEDGSIAVSEYGDHFCTHGEPYRSYPWPS